MELTAENVEKVIKDCLFQDEEIINDQIPNDAIKVNGIATNYGFHPNRLEQYRLDIIDMLSQLPNSFMVEGGGGMSFLEACNRQDGVQWADCHKTMEGLFCLGEGIGKVKLCMPRELWNVLPGGAPYYMVNLK